MAGKQIGWSKAASLGNILVSMPISGSRRYCWSGVDQSREREGAGN